jgi:aromatic ring-opening dioxygenase LigB subunit
MPIITAALVPHPPLLIPEIGKDNWGLLEKTYNSYKRIEEDIYAGQVETIVIISAHGPEHENIFSINIGENYDINFEEFGDFSVKASIKGDHILAQTLKESLGGEININLFHKPKVDHSIGIPAYLISNHPQNKPESFKRLKFLPLHFSGQDLEKNYEFGQKIKRQLQASSKRIAVLASGDLSHCLSSDAPAGYSAKGTKFDKKITDLLQDKDFKNIPSLNPKIIEEVQTCAPKPIAILAGMLENINCQPELLSYEAPFGVGYLTMKFNF